MSQQQTLEVALREHDLPPMWDGLAVVWGGWLAPPPAFICPPPRPECCAACGAIGPAVINHGRVARTAAVTHEQVAEVDAARNRLPPRLRHKVKSRALHRLVAYRCVDCRHDVVVDNVTGETWDLDVTDYGDRGSRRPS